MKVFRIGEVAELTRTPASTLRYYEQVGALPEARRVGGQRRYDEGIVAIVAAIKLAIRSGFRLAEIRDAREADSLQSTLDLLVDRKLRENEEAQQRLRRSHELLEAIADCPCTDLSACELLQAV